MKKKIIKIVREEQVSELELGSENISRYNF